MKRVCIITSVHSPFEGRIFYKQAKTLIASGYDVLLIGQHDKDEIVDGVKLIALPKSKHRLLRMLRTWRVFRLALKQKADVYHFHDPELLLWGWLLQKLSRRPVIYDVHENYGEIMYFKEWIPIFLRKPIAWIFTIVEMIIADKLSAIITVTEPMRERFSNGRALCVSVCNFPSLDFIAKAKEEYKMGNNKAKYSIIYTGAIKKTKGFETALNTLDLLVRQNPKTTCIILAKQKNFEWLDEKHHCLMNKLISEGNLIIKERVPYNEVFSYLDAVNIGWVPESPYQDAISTKTLEYMACGKPIVSSNLPLTNEIINKAECGILVEPLDTSAHASAILYLLKHPEEAKRMGENGRQAIVKEYNWEMESNKLIAIYEHLLEGEL